MTAARVGVVSLDAAAEQAALAAAAAVVRGLEVVVPDDIRRELRFPHTIGIGSVLTAV